MKKTIKYLFAAMALIAAASCQKEAQPQEPNEKEKGTRVVELIFDDDESTKGTLEGMTPTWAVGDKIMVASGGVGKPVTLTAENIVGNKAIITTELSGTLSAVYPASAYKGLEGEKICIEIPSATDGSFANAHIAVAEGTTTLNFKNVVSILKIETDATNDAEIKGINIAATDANISGEFKVTYSSLTIEPGSSPQKAVNLLYSESGVKYVAVAPGAQFNDLKFTVVKNDNSWAQTGSTQTAVMKANKIYDLGKLSAIPWSLLTYYGSGSIYGVFSVSADSKVHFSKGNLQATIDAYGAPTAWKFATNQYDYLGDGGANKTIGSAAGDVDLFGWSTSATTYGISTSTDNSDYSGPFADWGAAYCSSKSITPTTTWRTLTKAEWDYLLGSRSGYRYVKATLTSVGGGAKGLVLFPDGFSLPSGLPEFDSENKPGRGFDDAKFDAQAWAKLETAGCVFLPAAGYRTGSVVSADVGCYWSSNYFGDTAKAFLIYYYNTAFPETQIDRSQGSSVRLVTENLYL